jgi:hypothetical protein
MQESDPSSLRATTVRPGGVDWTGHDELKPYLPEMGAAKNLLAAILLPVMRYSATSRLSPTEPLGRFLTGMAMGMWDGALQGEGVQRLLGGSAVVENKGFRRLMGLDAVKGK